MSIAGVLTATVLVGAIGLFIGAFLGFSGKKFEVAEDEKVMKVRDALPGSNCGGCGYPGCDGLAKAIALGEAPVHACPVGGESVIHEIATIMGVEVTKTTPMTAFVKCHGDCKKTKENYIYTGVEDCKVQQFVPAGGSKSCNYGCLGFGNCVKKCPFEAIHIINGIAVVDKKSCRACGMCVEACPINLIELIPYGQKVLVACHSKDKGKTVINACQIGCIGCKKCEKKCPFDAIHIVDDIACIDFDKCKNCGICKKECPRKCII